MPSTPPSGTPNDRRLAPRVSVLAPVFNEEQVLGEFIERCVDACEAAGRPWELVLVDDGSRDRSPDIIAEAARRHGGRVVGVMLNRNYGQHAAIMAGFRHTRGDFVVTLDSDLQNPPEEIVRVVEALENEHDVVGTIRRDRHDSAFRRFASNLVNKTIRRVTGVEMHDYGCMLRGYRRSIVNAMLDCPERSTFIPVLGNMFARHTTEIPVEHAARPDGESRYGLWKLINLQFDLLTSMTTFPLRMLSVMGVVVAMAGIGFGALLAILRFAFGEDWAAEGVFSLFAVLFVFVGLQFIGMGLLGEYLGRVYHDVRGRPRYIVADVLGRPSAAAAGAGRRESALIEVMAAEPATGEDPS